MILGVKYNDCWSNMMNFGSNMTIFGSNMTIFGPNSMTIISETIFWAQESDSEVGNAKFEVQSPIC